MSRKTLESPNFPTLLNRWIEYCRAEGLSSQTITDYQVKVGVFLRWLGDDKMPDNVTPDYAQAFISHLRDKKLAQASILTYVLTAKVFFNFLVRKKYLKISPFTEDVKFRTRANRVIKTVSKKDLYAIFMTLTTQERLTTFSGVRDLAIITLFIDSGIRSGELLSIRRCDVDLASNRAIVNGKTGQRFAMFSEACKVNLRHYLEIADLKPDDFIWRGIDGNRLSASGLKSLIRRIENLSGVDFYAHKLRHTYATMLAAEGVNVFDLKELMGHSSINTTQIYVGRNVERLQEVYRTNSPYNLLRGQEDAPKEITKRPKGRPSKYRE